MTIWNLSSGEGVADNLNISNPGTPGGLVAFSLSLSDLSVCLVEEFSNFTGFCVNTIGLEVLGTVTSLAVVVAGGGVDVVVCPLVTGLNEKNEVVSG